MSNLISKYLEKTLDCYFSTKLAKRMCDLLNWNLMVFTKKELMVDEYERTYMAVLVRQKQTDAWVTAERIYPNEALMQLATWSAEAEDDFIASHREWWERLGE